MVTNVLPKPYTEYLGAYVRTLFLVCGLGLHNRVKEPYMFQLYEKNWKVCQKNQHTL